MSKTKKNNNNNTKAGAPNDYNNTNRSVLSSQPILLHSISLNNGNNHQINHNNNNNNNTNHYNNGHEAPKAGTVKKNKKIDKSQISGPTGFRVVQHVGLTNNNFEVNKTSAFFFSFCCLYCLFSVVILFDEINFS